MQQTCWKSLTLSLLIFGATQVEAGTLWCSRCCWVFFFFCQLQNKIKTKMFTLAFSEDEIFVEEAFAVRLNQHFQSPTITWIRRVFSQNLCSVSWPICAASFGILQTYRFAEVVPRIPADVWLASWVFFAKIWKYSMLLLFLFFRVELRQGSLSSEQHESTSCSNQISPQSALSGNLWTVPLRLPWPPFCNSSQSLKGQLYYPVRPPN